jgi:hypothetical protein
MLLEESSISPEIVAKRGYETIRSRTKLLDFKKYQRRAPGLLIPLFSPDGETTSCQLRPDEPRKDKKSKPLKYETPGGSKVILDVHPSMLEEVRHGTGDLWITEGIKKADALTSRGLPTVGLIGVWNFQRDGEMLPCWDYVNLKDRRVNVVYDNDVMVKEGVQLALERSVAYYEKRGADVRVVYLPEGPHKGVDDYLAAGHTVAELKILARKFEPADIGTIRMSRDEKLRGLVEDLRGRWWAEEWKGRGGHSDRDVALKLIEAAGRSGKPHADGIRVKLSWGALQVQAKIARRTLAKSLARLEERGFLYRDNDSREADKTGAFVLRASVDQVGGSGPREEKATQSLQACTPGGLHLRAPLCALPDVVRLRWSRPAYKPRRGTVSETCRVRDSKPPEPRDRIDRLGKIRGAVVDALRVSGGTLTLRELCDVLRRKRARDVRRRILPMLVDAGIVIVEGDNVALTQNWREKLDAAREIGQELEADQLAEARRRRKSRAYRERFQVKPSRHYVNADADGHAEELQREEPEAAPDQGRKVPEVSKLAAAIRDYLDLNPGDACEPAGWIASTLWCLDLYPGKPTLSETRVAIEDLGGEKYLRRCLELAREAWRTA